MKKNCLLIFFVFVFSVLNAQTRNINGRLYILDNLPLNGIKLVATKTGATTITDSLGKFSIIVDKTDVVIVESKEFSPTKFRVKANTDSIVSNVEFLRSEEGVRMLVGAGYLDANYLVDAVQQLHPQKDYSRYPNIYEAIRAEFYAAKFSGRGCVILNHGPNSLYLSQCALLIVDGLQVNDLESVSLPDIQSIEIVRDNDASFWGIRGANGVVVVKTKNSAMNY